MFIKTKTKKQVKNRKYLLRIEFKAVTFPPKKRNKNNELINYALN